MDRRQKSGMEGRLDKSKFVLCENRLIEELLEGQASS